MAKIINIFEGERDFPQSVVDNLLQYNHAENGGSYCLPSESHLYLEVVPNSEENADQEEEEETAEKPEIENRPTPKRKGGRRPRKETDK